MAARRRQHALGRKQILDAERQTFQRPALALGELRVRRLGHLKRLVGGHRHIGIERRRFFHRLEVSACQLNRGDLFGLERITRTGQCQLCQITHHSTTLGTT